MSDKLASTYEWVQAYLRKERQYEPAEIETVIAPSERLTGEERLQIHRNQHWIKLHNALGHAVPNVRRFMGDKAFATLARRFLTAHPLRSYTVFHLHDPLVAWLESQPNFTYRPFVLDMARLEVASHDAANDPIEETLTLADVAGRPWEEERLVPIRALRLMTFQHRVYEYTKFTGETRRDMWTDIGPTWVLIVRRDLMVERYPFIQDEYTLLKALMDGQPLAQAQQTIQVDPELVRSKVEAWIRGGLFVK